LVCKLKRSLYGLKQSPRMWYQKFDAFSLKVGFVRSEEDNYVYLKIIDDQVLIIVLYVDDMLFIGNNKEMIRELKRQLSKSFDMKDLGAAKYILRMDINMDLVHRKLWLSQSKYVDTILQRFNMHDCKPFSIPFLIGTKLKLDMCPTTNDAFEEMSNVPYASVVGSLMYAMVCTRPYIAQAVGVLSKFMFNPSK